MSRDKQSRRRGQEHRHLRESTKRVYAQFLEQHAESKAAIDAAERKARVASDHAERASKDAAEAARKAAAAARAAEEEDAKAQRMDAMLKEVTLRETQQKPIYLAKLINHVGDRATVENKLGMQESVRLPGNLRIDREMHGSYVLVDSGTLKGLLEEGQQIKRAKELAWKSNSRSANTLFSRSGSLSRSRSASPPKVLAMFGRRKSLSPIDE